MTSVVEARQPEAVSTAGFWALALALVLLPFVAVLTPLGMVPLVLCSATLALVLSWRSRPWRRFPRRFAALLAAVAVWAAFTAFWAIEPDRAVRTASGWLGVSFAGLILVAAAGTITQAQAKRLALLLLVGLGLIEVFALSEWANCGWVASHLLRITDFCNGGYFIYKRTLTVTAFMGWPAVWLAWRAWPDSRKRFAGLGVLAFICLPAYLLGAMAAVLSVVLGGVVVAATLVFDRKLVRCLAVLFVLVVGATPFVASQIPDPRSVWLLWPQMPGSAHHRLTIWNFVAGKWAEHPWRGWGMEASRAIPGAEESAFVRLDHPDGSYFVSSEQVLPLHPHSAPLQWWLELGAPGAALLAALGVTVFGFVGRAGANRLERGLATATASSAVMISLVSYGAWQSWWLCCLWLVGALCAAANRTRAAQSAA